MATDGIALSNIFNNIQPLDTATLNTNALIKGFLKNLMI